MVGAGGGGGGREIHLFISRGIEWSSGQNHLDPCLKKLFAPSNLADTV